MTLRTCVGLALLGVISTGCDFKVPASVTTLTSKKDALTSNAVSNSPGSGSSTGSGSGSGSGGSGSGGSGSGGSGSGGGAGTGGAFPGTVSINSPDRPALAQARSWYAVVNSGSNYMVTLVASNKDVDPSALTTAKKCPGTGVAAPPCADGDNFVAMTLCTADKANMCKAATVKTYSSLNGAIGTLPYLSIMAQVCKAGAMVTYMPSNKFDTSAMPFGYKNRPGQLTVESISSAVSEKVAAAVTGAVLFKNGDESTTDKITLNASLKGLQIYSPPACIK